MFHPRAAEFVDMHSEHELIDGDFFQHARLARRLVT
jgi:hypothetical protein